MAIYRQSSRNAAPLVNYPAMEELTCTPVSKAATTPSPSLFSLGLVSHGSIRVKTVQFNFTTGCAVRRTTVSTAPTCGKRQPCRRNTTQQQSTSNSDFENVNYTEPCMWQTSPTYVNLPRPNKRTNIRNTQPRPCCTQVWAISMTTCRYAILLSANLNPLICHPPMTRGCTGKERPEPGRCECPACASVTASINYSGRHGVFALCFASSFTNPKYS